MPSPNLRRDERLETQPASPTEPRPESPGLEEVPDETTDEPARPFDFVPIERRIAEEHPENQLTE